VSLWRRRQLFEFQDQPWFPDVIREGQVEVLSRATRSSGLADALVPAFADLVDETRPRAILDLCSGGGGPVVALLEAVAASGRRPPPVLLSDLYPNPAAWGRLRDRWPERVDFVTEPVDATQLPASVDAELVTIVNALHHFPMDTVEAIIDQVTGRGASLFAAEGFPRSLLRAAAMWPALGIAWARNPFSCPHGGRAKALWSFGVPVLTVTGMWDWFASALRIHEPDELLAVARRIAPQYRWSTGAGWYPPWGKAWHLSGTPR
jgi:hypothetical protein